MILVDHDIRTLVQEHQLIVEGFNDNNVSNCSYDLTIDKIYADTGKKGHGISECDLDPGQVVFVKTKEKLKIPDNLVGIIGEKNSRMRQGLIVAGPHYQPGHETYGYLRVQNVSSNTIVIRNGDSIAQIFFEQLTSKPDKPYDGTFQNEEDYNGLGNYEQAYLERNKEYADKQIKKLDERESSIYANVITLMGVFVAIFSIISINYQAFTQATVDFKFIISMNITLAVCIIVMLLMVYLIVRKFKGKR